MKHVLFIITICLFFALSLFAQKNKAASRLTGLDTAFARVLQNYKAAGFAVAVVEKDKVIYSKGFGYSNYETKTPVTPNTLFAIGSCTKAFTAGLLGLLNKDGKVDFDKPLRTYLPQVSFYNTDLNNTITLRDMMSHRTGLPRHDLSWYFLIPTAEIACCNAYNIWNRVLRCGNAGNTTILCLCCKAQWWKK